VLPAFLRPKGMQVYSNSPKRCGDGCLADVIRVNRDLMLALTEIILEEDGTATGVMSEVQHVGQRVGVRLCNQVQSPKIPTI
jgi:hypothetical protein